MSYEQTKCATHAIVWREGYVEFYDYSDHIGKWLDEDGLWIQTAADYRDNSACITLDRGDQS